MRVKPLFEAPTSRGAVYFFAGWGMNERPFATWHIEPSDVDVYLVSHYGDGGLSSKALAELIDSRKSSAIVAWSFGVRRALDVLNCISLTSTSERSFFMAAVNGTFTPVSRNDGISRAIVQKTLNGLCKDSLENFYVNMALQKRSSFSAPDRTIDSLADELRFLIEHSPERLGENDRTTMKRLHIKAYISLKDRIIPSRAQKNFWENARADGFAVETIESDTAHWDPSQLQEALLDATTHL